MATRLPGRPIDRSNRPAIRRLEIWLYVEEWRALYYLRFAREPSTSEIVGWIEKRGGISSAIGGHAEAILAAVSKDNGRKAVYVTRRSVKSLAGGGKAMVENPRGKIFVSDVQRHKDSIRVRYQEAKRMLLKDQRLRVFYENQLADRLCRAKPHAIGIKPLVRPW